MKIKFKSLIISNILEGYCQNYSGLPSKERTYWTLYDTLDSNRALLYDHDDKVIITSTPINKKHFHHITQVMGWGNVWNIFPQTHSISISEDILRSSPFQTQIIDIIKKNPGINIIPYRATQQFYNLIHYLKKLKLRFTTPESIPFNQQFINQYVHCKRGFRHIWSLAYPNHHDLAVFIPQGFITTDKTEAIEAAWWFQQKKRSFVIKYNRGVQGIGVLFHHYRDLPKTRKDFVREISHHLSHAMWNEPCIIVEEMIHADSTQLGGSPSVEFFISPQGTVSPLYACEQILEKDLKTFRGVYIRPECEQSTYIKAAYEAGMYFGRELAQLGYRGFFDIDLVISKDHKLYALEANLRRTGGTHIHQAALSLLGKNYNKIYYVAGEEIMLPSDSKLSYEKAYEILADWEYNPKTKYGFLFGNPDMLQVGILYALFFAPSSEKMEKLRSEVKTRLRKVKS